MEAEAAKYIGAGLACFGMAGTALGLGNIFGQYLSGALRNRPLLTASSAVWCSVSPLRKLWASSRCSSRFCSSSPSNQRSLRTGLPRSSFGNRGRKVVFHKEMQTRLAFAYDV